MNSFLLTFARETLDIFLDSAPYMALGVFLSGLLKAFIDPSWIQRYLGGKGMSPVFRASIAGVPLPLCSCGVIPAAAALRKQGASSSATVSFLISTPESGVDSIAISYAILDPILTVARPLVAFASAMTAGALSVFFGGPETAFSDDKRSSDHHGHHHDHHCASPASRPSSLINRIRDGVWFAISDIWGDLAKPFFLGVALSGLISASVPQSFLEEALGGGLSSMLIMLIAGIPMYICATSSTPLAAALILKGVSPGAALVFLMAGPATNISALPVIHKILGSRRMVIYLASIATVSVAAGMTVDWIYGLYGISARATVGQGVEHLPLWVHHLAGAGLLLLWAFNSFRHESEKQEKIPCSCNKS